MSFCILLNDRSNILKSINQIRVDHILNRVRYQCDEDYEALRSTAIEQELNYDHEGEDLKVREFLEQVDAALVDPTMMASMLDIGQIDELTFHAVRIAIRGITRDLHYADIAELDRAFEAISAFLKNHPKHPV